MSWTRVLLIKTLLGEMTSAELTAVQQAIADRLSAQNQTILAAPNPTLVVMESRESA